MSPPDLPEFLPEFLTVPELAALLRIKERKVYDLAGSGALPCLRATGKLLFPEAEIRAWMARSRSGPEMQTRPAVMLGSHDPLLAWAIAQSGCGLASFLDGSGDGVTRFCAGEGVAAGVHLHEGGAAWNMATIAGRCAGQNAALLGFARRCRGLVMRDPVPDLAAIAGRLRVPRQPGSGAEQLFAHLAAEAGLDPTPPPGIPVARSETEAVQLVARGVGDVTLGLESVARDFGLAFVPLIEESFDLLIDRRAWFDPPMQRLMDFTSGAAFRAQAGLLGGYDVTDLGKVRWND